MARCERISIHLSVHDGSLMQETRCAVKMSDEWDKYWERLLRRMSLVRHAAADNDTRAYGTLYENDGPARFVCWFGFGEDKDAGAGAAAPATPLGGYRRFAAGEFC